MPPEAKPSMPNPAQVAAALADERLTELARTLIDGRAWTPIELANYHGWPRSSTDERLNVLIDTGLITETRQGTHRYVRLAGAQAGETIERLTAPTPATHQAGRCVRGRRNERLRAGRTCYQHLAGRLGVQLRDGLLTNGVVSNDNGYAVTPEGFRWFDKLGYPLGRRGSTDRRVMVRPCLDWTERVDHLAGIVADTLCFALTERGWIIRSDSDRAVRLSESGAGALTELGLLRPESTHQRLSTNRSPM